MAGMKVAVHEGKGLVDSGEEAAFWRSCESTFGVRLPPLGGTDVATVGDLYELVSRRAASARPVGELKAQAHSFSLLKSYFEARGCGLPIRPETSLLAVLDPDIKREWQALRSVAGRRLRPLELNDGALRGAGFIFGLGLAVSAAAGYIVARELHSAWLAIGVGSLALAMVFLVLELYAQRAANTLPERIATVGDLARSLAQSERGWRRTASDRLSATELWTVLTETIRRETGFDGPITHETPVFVRFGRDGR